MKKLISLLLAVILLSGLCVSASAAQTHSEEKYLSDTLTLAGDGFDSVRSLTVSVIEALADTSIGYENEYSMMTSGSVFSKHVFKGVKLYDLLVNEGLSDDLADSTPVKCISKDGYTIPLTLGDLRSEKYGRYSEKGGTLEEQGLPVIVAFSSDGESLVGPTGTESVYKQFGEDEGYIAAADNIGGPLRLILGQTDPYEFNAPNCSKWLAAIVVGDAGDYVYSRDTEAALDDSEPDRTGDWTHGNAQSEYSLTVSGSEAGGTYKYSLSDIESMEGRVREYYAASAGRYAFEGIPLSVIISDCLSDGLEAPTKITVKASDGFSKSVDVGTVMNGVDSFYQPGKHRDVLLAWAVDGSPLVPGEYSDGYDGTNAYGPIRLIVENTISLWVKNVTEIVIGEDTESAVSEDTGEEIRRADFIVRIWNKNGSPTCGAETPFYDVADDRYYSDAVRWAYKNGIIEGYGFGRFGTYDLLLPEHRALIIERLERIGANY